ncbi:MAG: hypothetical protein U0736_26255 [Gemmataceae bacterium]
MFVKDLQSGVIVRASVASDGVEGNDSSNGVPAIGDGRYVAFGSSYASNLVPGDTNRAADVFVKTFRPAG